MTLVEFFPKRTARLHAYSYYPSLNGALKIQRYRDTLPLPLVSIMSQYALMTLVEFVPTQQFALVRGPQRTNINSADLKWGVDVDGRGVLYGVYVPDVETGLMMLHMGFSI